MKWSKQWLAAVMLLPAIYLTSCGSGEKNGDSGNEVSTQSPPPVDTSSFDINSSSIRGGGTDNPASVATGSAGVTGNAGSEPGNTGMSSSDNSVTTASDETNFAKSKTAKVKTNDRRKGTTQKRALTRDKTTSVDDTLTLASSQDESVSADLERMADTASRNVREFGDTVARKMKKLVDSAAKIVDEISDTTGSRINALSDTLAGISPLKVDSIMIEGANNTKIDSALSSIDRSKDSTTLPSFDSSRKTSTPDSGINFTPSVFIADQIRSNNIEIRLARMAVDKSQNEDVKQIARTLETDHSVSLRELQVMSKGSMSGTDSMSTSENEMARQHTEMMKNLAGQDFDRQWLQHMHMMHDQKIQMFEQAETNNSIQDAQLRIWVNQTIPILRKHRDMLAQTLSSINK